MDYENDNPPPTALWQWAELAAALGLPATTGPTIHRIVADSRLVEEGDLFIALAGDPGDRFNPAHRSRNDGHNYLVQARSQGAAGALVQAGHASARTPADLPRLFVEDTYTALWELGQAARQRQSGPIVAVTGSSGKTTLKTFLGAALKAYTSPGSFNNHIGVPLSLVNMPVAGYGPGAGVFEIGTNHPGEIQPLAHMCAPDVAVVLNVHQAHIENFGSRQNLVEEKISIFNELKDLSYAVSEDTLALDFGQCFGFTDRADVRVDAVNGDRCQLRVHGKPYSARVPGGGEHRALCVAASVLILAILEQDLAPGLELSSALVPGGRGNICPVGEVNVTDDSYNANPASMQASLSSMLTAAVSGRRIAVIGEMGELGAFAENAHLALSPALQLFDLVYCVGPGTRDLASALGAQWYADVIGEDLCIELTRQCQAGDAVLVKGSNRVFWVNDFVPRLLRHLAGE